jgi:hypothetical protein
VCKILNALRKTSADAFDRMWNSGLILVFLEKNELKTNPEKLNSP